MDNNVIVKCFICENTYNCYHEGKCKYWDCMILDEPPLAKLHINDSGNELIHICSEECLGKYTDTIIENFIIDCEIVDIKSK